MNTVSRGCNNDDTQQQQTEQEQRRQSSSLAILPVDFRNTQLTRLQQPTALHHHDTSGWLQLRQNQSHLPVVPLQQVSPGMDLNIPPDNWLRGIHRAMELGERQHSSFRVAASVADKISWNEAAIDLISNSQIIKQLLRSSISKEALSLVVHRVGDTVLVDEFDIDPRDGGSGSPPKEANASTQNTSDMNHSDEQYDSKDRSGVDSGCQSMLVTEKFHEKIIDKAKQLDGFVPKLALPRAQTKKNKEIQRRERLLSKFVARSIDPSATTTAQDGTVFGAEHQHAWVFRNLRCLLSSDLSIFGDESHPAVSLRLRQADASSIQVLTGMDMWLDNLMCNVPEVMMCYHLNGIVKQYELIKTSDIPTVAGFEPTVVQDIAQNITSFLRSNCAKEGHTYWLYKDNNSDVVRLYDLTELCENGRNDNEQEKPSNPFAHPVAMLLFRIASRLYTRLGTSSESGDPDADVATVNSLLRNVLLLVDANKYPTVAANASYMLAGIACSPKVHADSYDTLPNLKQTIPELNSLISKPTERLTSGSTVADELLQGIVEIESSITSLTTADANDDPCVVILLEAAFRKATQLYLRLAEVFIATKDAQKAAMYIYFGLAIRFVFPLAAGDWKKSNYRNNYGGDSQNVAVSKEQLLVAQTQLATSSLVIDEEADVLLPLIELAADIFCQIDYFFPEGTSRGTIPITDFCSSTDTALMRKMEDFMLMLNMKGESDTWESLGLPLSLANCSNIDALKISIQLYNHCLGHANSASISNPSRIHKKLGNAYNMLGVNFMNRAASGRFITEHKANLVNTSTWQDAHQFFTKAVSAFANAKDLVNQALVSCNLGKLMRIACSSMLVDRQGGAPTKTENNMHDRAIQSYRAAAVALGDRNIHPQIWDSIYLELGGAHFAFGTFLQDNISGSITTNEGIGKVISERLMQSLQCYTTVVSQNPPESASRMGTFELPSWLNYRIASTYRRLAQLYGQTSAMSNQQNQKQMHRLALLYYQKASTGLAECKCDFPIQCLVEQIDAQLGVAVFQLKSGGRKAVQESLKKVGSITNLLWRLSDCISNMSDESETLLLVQNGITTAKHQAARAVQLALKLSPSGMKDGNNAQIDLRSLYSAILQLLAQNPAVAKIDAQKQCKGLLEVLKILV